MSGGGVSTAASAWLSTKQEESLLSLSSCTSPQDQDQVNNCLYVELNRLTAIFL